MSSDRSIRGKRPEPLGSILAKLFAESHWGEQFHELQALARWREIVGPQIAKQAQPESFKDGILVVRVENSVWLSHLRFLTAELQEKLNREMASPAIKEIRFRLGPVNPDPIPGSQVKSPRARR